MTSIYSLSDSLSSKIKDAFVVYQADSNQINELINSFIDSVMYTEKGNLRQPKKYEIALRVSALNIKKMFELEYVYFCHIVNNKVCLRLKNTNALKINSGIYKVNVNLYVKGDSVDTEVLKGDKESGFYYLSGKPYFKSPVREVK